MQIPFKDVQLGEKFVTHYSKRRYGGVKVAPTTIVDSHGGTFLGNSVILTDHVDALAYDAGAIVVTDENEPVEVQRKP
jgi:hypothetical protein